MSSRVTCRVMHWLAFILVPLPFIRIDQAEETFFNLPCCRSINIMMQPFHNRKIYNQQHGDIDNLRVLQCSLATKIFHFVRWCKMLKYFSVLFQTKCLFFNYSNAVIASVGRRLFNCSCH